MRGRTRPLKPSELGSGVPQSIARAPTAAEEEQIAAKEPPTGRAELSAPAAPGIVECAREEGPLGGRRGEGGGAEEGEAPAAEDAACVDGEVDAALQNMRAPRGRC